MQCGWRHQPPASSRWVFLIPPLHYHCAISPLRNSIKELDIRGSRNSLNLIPEALEMLAKHQDLAAELITHDFEFAQLPKAFETMGDRNAQVGKIVIDLPAANAPDSTAQLQEVHPA